MRPDDLIARKFRIHARQIVQFYDHVGTRSFVRFENTAHNTLHSLSAIFDGLVCPIWTVTLEGCPTWAIALRRKTHKRDKQYGEDRQHVEDLSNPS